MTAIIKKIKVGLSQEEIDDLKPFNGTYDGDINANGFISIQNKNITFGGAKSNSVEVSFKNGSRNGNSSEELAFLSDVVGSGVAQSVINLGELSGSPLKENHDVLDNIITPGLYTFIWMSTGFFMSVYNSGSVVIQRITDRFSSYYERRKSGEIWSFTSYDYSNGNLYTSSGDTSKKLYLIGAQTITDKGTRTYTHDTVYIDTDGHLYDSGKRVLTTADNVGSGGAVSGDYLPHHTVTLTNNTTPMSTVLSAYGNGLYAITFDGPASGKYIFNVQHQGGTRYGMSAIDINTNAISYYDSEDMSTVTAADFKNSFTSFLKTTGGAINGDLSVAGALSLTDSVYTDKTKGLLERTSKSAFGFSDEGEPVIVNTSGYNGFLLGGALDNGAFYEFPEKPDDAGLMYVPCTSEQGTSGQVLTSNGNGTYKWSTLTSGGGTVSGEQIAIQEFFSNSTYTYKTDFDWSKLTLDNFDEYCVRFLRFNGGNHEILKPEKVFASSIGNTYYFENTVIGIKVVMSSTGTATISTYIPNNEGIPTSLAAFSSASAGIYGTTLTSGLYSFNCLLDDGSYLNFTMDLNQDASYTQVSPIIKDWGEDAFERLSYYKGTLKYVDQDGQPLSSYNTIQIRRLYSY